MKTFISLMGKGELHPSSDFYVLIDQIKVKSTLVMNSLFPSMNVTIEGKQFNRGNCFPVDNEEKIFAAIDPELSIDQGQMQFFQQALAKGSATRRFRESGVKKLFNTDKQETLWELKSEGAFVKDCRLFATKIFILEDK